MCREKEEEKKTSSQNAKFNDFDFFCFKTWALFAMFNNSNSNCVCVCVHSIVDAIIIMQHTKKDTRSRLDFFLSAPFSPNSGFSAPKSSKWIFCVHVWRQTNVQITSCNANNREKKPKTIFYTLTKVITTSLVECLKKPEEPKEHRMYN